MLHQAGIRTGGLFLNADAGFDTKKLRSLCYENGIIPNFYLNSRSGKLADRDDYFHSQLYKHRTVIEHAFAWTVAAQWMRSNLYSSDLKLPPETGST